MEKKVRRVSELKMHLKMGHQITCKDEDDYYGVPRIWFGLRMLTDDKEVAAQARLELDRLNAKYPKKVSKQDQLRKESTK